MRAFPLRPTRWLEIAALLSALTLAGVHVMDRMGYTPCALCLHQREAFWTALAVGIGARLLAYVWSLAPRMGCIALGAAFAAGAGLAAYHAGVEWRWWPGPAACSGAGVHGGLSGASIGAVFSGATKLHIVSCEDAALRVLGLSLAGWNALFSAALSVVSFAVPALSRSRT